MTPCVIPNCFSGQSVEICFSLFVQEEREVERDVGLKFARKHSMLFIGDCHFISLSCSEEPEPLLFCLITQEPDIKIHCPFTLVSAPPPHISFQDSSPSQMKNLTFDVN